MHYCALNNITCNVCLGSACFWYNSEPCNVDLPPEAQYCARNEDRFPKELFLITAYNSLALAEGDCLLVGCAAFAGAWYFANRLNSAFILSTLVVHLWFSIRVITTSAYAVGCTNKQNPSFPGEYNNTSELIIYASIAGWICTSTCNGNYNNNVCLPIVAINKNTYA